MEAVRNERRCGFKSGMNRLEFRFKMTHDRAAIVARSRRDRGLIVRRLCIDRGLIVRRLCIDRAVDPQENIVCRSWNRFHNEGHTIAARSRHDRGSIGPRSWSSFMNPLRRTIEFHVTGWSRSHDYVDQDCEERPPSDEGRSRSRCRPFDEDPALQHLPRVTR